MRKIAVANAEWQFLVGASAVKLRSPTGKGYVVTLEKITGREKKDFGWLGRGGNLDGWYKKGDPTRGAVTPKHICAWIEKIQGEEKKP